MLKNKLIIKPTMCRGDQSLADNIIIIDGFAGSGKSLIASIFGLVTGLSDHTIDNATAIASVALGVSIIEKHVTLNRNGDGPDDSFSLESKELKELCVDVKTAWKALGKVDYGKKSSEQDNIKFRRSLYFVKDIRKGEVVTRNHIKSIRPGYGATPSFFEDAVGCIAIKDIHRGSPLKMKDLK